MRFALAGNNHRYRLVKVGSAWPRNRRSYISAVSNSAKWNAIGHFGNTVFGCKRRNIPFAGDSNCLKYVFNCFVRWANDQPNVLHANNINRRFTQKNVIEACYTFVAWVAIFRIRHMRMRTRCEIKYTLFLMSLEGMDSVYGFTFVVLGRKMWFFSLLLLLLSSTFNDDNIIWCGIRCENDNRIWILFLGRWTFYAIMWEKTRVRAHARASDQIRNVKINHKYMRVQCCEHKSSSIWNWMSRNVPIFVTEPIRVGQRVCTARIQFVWFYLIKATQI